MSQIFEHRVTVKVALLNTTADRVMMAVLPWGGFGLPGGHVDAFEAPDAALRRELQEELGLTEGDYHNLQREDFWWDDSSNRIILAYRGVLRDGIEIVADPSEVVGVRWVSLGDLEDDDLASNRYHDYIKAILQKTI